MYELKKEIYGFEGSEEILTISKIEGKMFPGKKRRPAETLASSK